MKQVTSKGHLIDEYCSVKGELVEHNNKIYSCTLNQTDISFNTNKFYVMQLIKNGAIDDNYALFTKYGRVGEPGRPHIDTYASEIIGRNAFEKLFKTKTGNLWSTANFVKKSGKYFMSDVSYDELKNIPQPVTTNIPDSKLNEKVQKLIKMLSDVNMMQNALVTLDIDTKKLPLGKITQSQLDKGSVILDKIQPLITKIISEKLTLGPSELDNIRNELTNLSSEYYTYLPMAFGRRKPTIINSDDIVCKYRDTLDELRNMVVTVQITNNIKQDENPIDSIYKSINTNINPLDKNNNMWKEIEKYVANTHGPTHGCKLEIIDIFEIEQHGKREIFDKNCANINNRTLLYHGTPISCCNSIFKNDFYLDPTKLNNPCIQIAGKLLGYGVYFADSCSKSINYCRANTTNNIGCLLLSEIALGNVSTRNGPDYDITKAKLAKTNHHSAQGLGQWEPETSTIIDGIKIPNGKLENIRKNTYLKYNEFVVYDINQILIRYLIVVKNNGNYNF